MLNDVELAHAFEELAGKYRLTPASLYHKLDPTWMPKPFLVHTSVRIAHHVAKPNGRLCISWPARMGKSTLATIATPIWILENFPKKEIMLASYGSDLSTGFGRIIRDYFNNSKGILHTRLRSDVQNVGHFMTTENGGMSSVGLSGALTGKGADVLIIDDYIKNNEEATSKLWRDSVWSWFQGTAMPRLEPGGSVIIVATRWHPDDLIGRLQKEQGDKWEFIALPALAGKDCPFGRSEGDALFPERYTKEDLLRKKEEMSPRWFNAQFQQNPDDDADKLADRRWLKIIGEDDVPNFKLLPDRDRVAWRHMRCWDLSGTDKGGDFTVGVKMSVNKRDGETFIHEIKRKQLSPHNVYNLMQDTANNDGMGVEIVVEQEPASAGVFVRDHIIYDILPGFKVTALPSNTSKITKAQGFLAACESGKVKLVENKSWNEIFLDEFDTFGYGEHDDQVDAAAMGYNHIMGKPKRSFFMGKRHVNLHRSSDYAKKPVKETSVVW